MCLHAKDWAILPVNLALADGSLARTAIALLALREIAEERAVASREELAEAGQGLAELDQKQVGCLVESVAERLRIVDTAHAEVREMVEIRAEHLVAVGEVLLRVEDVIVPERVDRLRWHDRVGRILEVEAQEALVPDLNGVHLLAGPSFALFGLHQLNLDGSEVKEFDRSESGVEAQHSSRRKFRSRKIHINTPKDEKNRGKLANPSPSN